MFGAFAGYNYWFPKAFGFRLHEGLGKASFWCWLVGFYVAFMPLYVLGFLGMTRRMQHYDNPAWHPWLLLAAFGAAIILCGIGLQIAQIVVSIRRRDELRDETGDPWNGRSLEWATASPPPAFNFAMLPEVHGEEAYWGVKQRALEQAHLPEEPVYTDIELPRNSPTGFICAFFSTFMGFALIWHIWWLVILGLLGSLVTFVVFAWRDEAEYVIPAALVATIDGANRRARSRGACRPRPRAGCPMSAFHGASTQGGADPYQLGRGDSARDRGRTSEHAAKELPSKRIITGYGFWVFLISDIIMFSAFFAAYTVLVGATAGGPGGSAAVRPRQHRDRDRLPPRLELHLRPGQRGQPGAQQGVVLRRDAGHLPVRALLPGAGN